MKRPLVLLVAAALVASAAACGTDEEPGTVEPDEVPLTAAALPEEGSTEPVVIDYENPAGFAAADESGAVVLDRELGESSGLQLEGADPMEAIYIASYRLEEDTTGWDFEQRAAISDEYVEVSGSESDAVPIEALAGGKESVFRYASFRATDDKYVYQWNTFIFDGYDLVHVTCQWRNERELIQSGCHEFQSGLTIDHG